LDLVSLLKGFLSFCWTKSDQDEDQE